MSSDEREMVLRASKIRSESIVTLFVQLRFLIYFLLASPRNMRVGKRSKLKYPVADFELVHTIAQEPIMSAYQWLICLIVPGSLEASLGL